MTPQPLVNVHYVILPHLTYFLTLASLHFEEDTTLRKALAMAKTFHGAVDELRKLSLQEEADSVSNAQTHHAGTAHWDGQNRRVLGSGAQFEEQYASEEPMKKRSRRARRHYRDALKRMAMNAKLAAEKAEEDSTEQPNGPSISTSLSAALNT